MLKIKSKKGSSFLSKKIICISLILGSFCCFTGCETIEDKLAANVPKTSTLQPMTAIEYTGKINKSLLPVISSSETIQAHHLEIVKDKYPIKEEINFINKEIDNLQKTIGEIENLYVSKEYMEHKNSTIQHLNDYRKILQEYKLVLESKDKEKIKNKVIDIKNSIGTLKTDFSLYQR